MKSAHGSAFTTLLPALLALDLVLALALAPILLFVLVQGAWSTVPLPLVITSGAAAWTLSVPGIAAVFALRRDHPALRPGESDGDRRARIDETQGFETFAAPYWDVEDGRRVIRPFVRAYRILFGRALTMSLAFGLILGVLIALALGALGFSRVLGALLFALAVYAVLVEFTSLALVVECPLARQSAILRNAPLLTARAWPQAGIALAVLAVAAFLCIEVPLAFIVLGTGATCVGLGRLSEVAIEPLRQILLEEERADAGRGGDAQH